MNQRVSTSQLITQRDRALEKLSYYNSQIQQLREEIRFLESQLFHQCIHVWKPGCEGGWDERAEEVCHVCRCYRDVTLYGKEESYSESSNSCHSELHRGHT